MLDKVALSNWISASQISTYRLCPRKWGWNKLNKIPAPANKYAERGTRVHRVAERWLEKGAPVDIDTEEGKIFTPGLKFLPPPGTGMTEYMFTFSTETAVYNGLWDLLIPPEKPLKPNEIPPVTVIDHKTTTDFKWMKKISELCVDPQAVIYAVAAGAGVFQHDGVDPYIILNWVYYRANAKKPGAKKVTLYVMPDDSSDVEKKNTDTVGAISYSELMEQFAEIEAIAAQLLEHRRQGHKAPDLPYNVAGCKAFGGCPYAGDPCQLTFRDVLEGHMTQDLVAKAMAAKGNQTPSQSAVGEEPAPDQDLASKIAARTAAKAKSATAEADPAVVAQTQKEVGEAAPAVNPPGEAEPEAPAPETPEVPETPSTVYPLPETGISYRLGGAVSIAQGIVSARIFNHSDPSYVDEVAHLAVEISDKIAEVAKK